MLRMQNACREESVRLTAPAILHLEPTAGAARYRRRRFIALDEARMIETASRRLVADAHPWQPLPAPACELALLLHHAVHDCLYLTLAMRLGVPPMTADLVLTGKASRHDPGITIPTLAQTDRIVAGFQTDERRNPA